MKENRFWQIKDSMWAKNFYHKSWAYHSHSRWSHLCSIMSPNLFYRALHLTAIHVSKIYVHLINFYWLQTTNMIIGHLGLSTVIVSLDSFSKREHCQLNRHWNKWLTMVNKANINDNTAYHHLLDMAFNNSLALNESSSTMTTKWTTLFKEDKNWKSFLANAPFQLSVTKVIMTWFYVFC